VSDTVVVTGVGGPAGRAAAAWLSAQGLDVVGTDAREIEAAAGSFRLLPSAADPTFEKALLDLVSGVKASLLVPTVTEELPIAARMREALAALRCEVAISPPGAVEIANDKLRTARELFRLDLSHPITFGSSTPREVIGRSLGFPILAKPRFGRGGRGVKILRSVADLSRDEAQEMIFQEFIPGEEYDANLYVARSGAVLAAVMLRKTLLKGGVVGNALEVERAYQPAVRMLCLQVARELRLEGPLDMDVRLRSDGSPVLLEVNARIGANVLAAPEVLEALLIDRRFRR